MAFSAALHCLVLYLILRPPAPIFVKPSSIAWGNGGTSTRLTFHESLVAPADRDRAHHALRVPQHKPRHELELAKEQKNADADAQAARAGSPYGSLSQGPFIGYEARPALPLNFPDPPIVRSEIPDGVAGDVIIEITIDSQGNVTETRLLQSLGHGIDDKCLETLRSWRFRPATMNGAPIASRQDVHFHFPS